MSLSFIFNGLNLLKYLSLSQWVFSMTFEQVCDSALKSSIFFWYNFLSNEFIFAIEKNEDATHLSHIYTSMDYVSPFVTAS